MKGDIEIESPEIEVFAGESKEVKYKIENKTNFVIRIPKIQIDGDYVRLISAPNMLLPKTTDHILVEVNVPETYDEEHGLQFKIYASTIRVIR